MGGREGFCCCPQHRYGYCGACYATEVLRSRFRVQCFVRYRLYDKHCVTDRCVVCPFGNVGDCSKVGVVYQIECLTCSDTYIGETGRTLAVRLKEHLASKRRGNLLTPLGRHKNEVHAGNDFDIKCTILAYEKETSARKTLEAFWIRSRNPAMNNKNECLSITDEFMPFLSLCGL